MKINFLHWIAMSTILIGSLFLLYFSFLWFNKGNLVMGFGMLIMGLVALSNFYLHKMAMEGKK